MSLTILKEPALIDLSGSFMPLWIESDKEVTTTGGKFRTDLVFTDIPTEGYAINFSWVKGVAYTTFTDAPALNGQYYVPVTAPSLSNWISEVFIPALKGIYPLWRDYSFSTPAANTVRVEAINPGSDWDINFVFAPQVNMSLANQVPGVTEVRRNEFGINMILEYGAWEDTEGDLLRIDNFLNAIDGVSYFELKDLLFRKHISHPPSMVSNGIEDASSLMIKYRYRYGEAHGQPVVYFPMETGDFKYCLSGGRAKEDIVAAPDFYEDWLNTEINGNLISKFLTYRTTRRAMLNEPVYLYYLHSRASGDFYLKADIYFTDNTMITRTIRTQAGVKNKLYACSCGYEMISGFVTAGKTVKKWIVYVAKVAAQLGEPEPDYSNRITITPDTGSYPDQLFLLYTNNFGVYEIFCARGKVSYLSDNDITTGQRSFVYPEAGDREMITTDSVEEYSITVASGMMTKEEMEHYRELLAGRDVYLQKDDKRWPVRLDGGSLNLHDTYSYKNNGHTLKITLDPERYRRATNIY